MRTTPPATIPPDVVTASARWFAALVFFQSKGRGSRLTVAAARGAGEFREFEAAPRQIAYFVGFDATPGDVARLLTIMPHASNWTGTTLFVAGIPMRWDHLVERTMQCFVRSFSHPSPAEYCATVVDLAAPSLMLAIQIRLPGDLPPLAKPPEPVALLPCKHLHAAALRRALLVADLRSAVQTLALDSGCAWCPRFDLEMTRTIEVAGG